MNIHPAAENRHAPAALLDALAARFGERFSLNAAQREAHGRDESWHIPAAPDGVFYPECTEEVAEAVKLCRAHKTPIIAFGAGTSLEGQVAAPSGGISFDFSRMNRVLAVNAEDLDVRVEAGVTRKQLNEELRDKGLFFPVDPGANATLGGMAATRASGTNAVRYGTMRENVLSLKAVTAAGEVIETGGRARKSAAGYDMTHLLIGSEGTLGLITELSLKLYGVPEAMAAAVCAFADIEGAVASVIETIQCGLPVARIEILDALQVRACNAYSKLSLPEQPMLFLEFHCSSKSVEEQAAQFGEIASAHGGSGFDWAVKAEDRNRLWEARHNAYYAARALAPGKNGMVTDVCVPISQLARCIRETRADLDASSILAPLVGHVGDGNFHTIMLIDPDDAGEVAEAKRLHDRMVTRALALGGTSTGEHGIGSGKQAFLAEEHGDTLPLMRAVKQALDPENLLNPGKLAGI